MVAMRRQRGIILIIIIILAVVTVMFVGSAARLTYGNLYAGQSGTIHDDAERAAESGVQYALSQLRANPAWRGDLKEVTVNAPDLFVVEDNGNVVGLVRTPDQRWSQFRLRFNYQDGGPAEDGLPDPAMTLDSLYVSVNNLEGGAAAAVPRADGAGWSVTPGSERPFSTPAGTVCLAVEGRAGSGLLAASPANPNPAGVVATRKVVEAIFALQGALGEEVEESAMMAAQGVSVAIPPDGGSLSLSSTGSDKARLRSKGQVSVQGGDATKENLTGANAEVATPTSTVDARYKAADIGMAEEKPDDPFFRLLWDDVRKAQASDPTLKAGTYVWWEDGSLHYYDMSHQDYVAFIEKNPKDPGLPADLGSAVKPEQSDGKLKLVVGASVNVTPGTTDELNILVRAGAAEEPPASKTGGDEADALISLAGAEPDVLLKVLHKTQDLPPPAQNVKQGSAELYDDQGVFHGYLKWDLDTQEVKFGGDLQRLLWKLAAAEIVAGDQLNGTFNMFNAYIVASDLGVTAGEAPGELDLPGVSDKLTASDVELEFRGNGKEVVLTSTGSLHITGGLRGTDASIVSGGDIKVVGMAVDFAASQNQAVSLYAKGDIVMSTLDKTPDGNYMFQDVKMKGVVYSWGDFVAKLGTRDGPAGNLILEGSLIAYGGDPADVPGANGKGNVLITANNAELKFNSAYVAKMSKKLPETFSLQKLSWTNHLP